MAAHSSILAWRIPWSEEPGRLQSTGSQRVGHNWATSLSLSCQVTSVISFSLWLYGLWPARPLHPWNSPGKNTGVSSRALLQGIFLTQGSPASPALQVNSLPLSHQGSPSIHKQIPLILLSISLVIPLFFIPPLSKFKLSSRLSLMTVATSSQSSLPPVFSLINSLHSSHGDPFKIQTWSYWFNLSLKFFSSSLLLKKMPKPVNMTCKALHHLECSHLSNCSF